MQTVGKVKLSQDYLVWFINSSSGVSVPPFLSLQSTPLRCYSTLVSRCLLFLTAIAVTQQLRLPFSFHPGCPSCRELPMGFMPPSHGLNYPSDRSPFPNYFCRLLNDKNTAGYETNLPESLTEVIWGEGLPREGHHKAVYSCHSAVCLERLGNLE